MRGKNLYRERQQAAKRKAAIKASLINAALSTIERMWAAAVVLDSGFLPSERKAIADAVYAVRSIKGGWLGRR